MTRRLLANDFEATQAAAKRIEEYWRRRGIVVITTVQTVTDRRHGTFHAIRSDLRPWRPLDGGEVQS